MSLVERCECVRRKPNVLCAYSIPAVHAAIVNKTLVSGGCAEMLTKKIPKTNNHNSARCAKTRDQDSNEPKTSPQNKGSDYVRHNVYILTPPEFVFIFYYPLEGVESLNPLHTRKKQTKHTSLRVMNTKCAPRAGCLNFLCLHHLNAKNIE